MSAARDAINLAADSDVAAQVADNARPLRCDPDVAAKVTPNIRRYRIIRADGVRDIRGVQRMVDDLGDILDRLDLDDEDATFYAGAHEFGRWVLGCVACFDLPATRCDRCDGRGGWEHPVRGDEECESCQGSGWAVER